VRRIDGDGAAVKAAASERRDDSVAARREPAEKTEATAEDAVRRNDREHILHSWSAWGKADPVPVAGAHGAWFWDYDGKRYLDFSSQLVNLNIGHQHPKVVAAIKEYADRLCTIAPFHANDMRGEAARQIAEISPGDLDVVFFTNGGAEATENAVRLARLATGRHKVLAAYRSYHGATAAAITMTGDPRRWGSEPGVPGVVHFFGPYLYRSAFHSATEDEERDRALRHLEEVLAFEGSHTIAAIILEPVVGTNGILVPPDGYLEGVRNLCDRNGIVMIADEVMSGFGRCGEWWAVDRWNVIPDLIAFAKGVNSGYVPLGGVVISRRIAETFRDRPYPGGLTYSGHPLACAAAVASMDAFRDEGIVEHARMLGEEVFEPELRKVQARHPSVGEVRGLGCFWAIELVEDRDSRKMLVPYGSPPSASPMREIMIACRDRGLWPFVHFNRIHAVPPLITSSEEVREGIAILDEVLDIADRYAAETSKFPRLSKEPS
jgi:taurine---2-oxoglutarate transaminase